MITTHYYIVFYHYKNS